MPAAPHWLKERRRRRGPAGAEFPSMLLTFDRPVDTDMLDEVDEDLAADRPPGHRWVLTRETESTIRAHLIPASP